VDQTTLARRLVALVVVLTAVLVPVQSASAATGDPATDPFYRYTDAAPLESIAPGTVLKTRSLPYHLAGLPLLLRTTQLLFRTTGARGQATLGVTTVVRPLAGKASRRVVSYQSFYDSLNPVDQPSSVIAGKLRLPGGGIATAETGLVLPFLLAGNAVIITDTEGQAADLAAGPEYGHNTLDGIRAAFAAPATGLSPEADVAMIGYSGGAIATEWAAEMAPRYAPDVDRRLVGAAMGGVLVHPLHNLHYVDGSLIWGGVLPLALVGLARAYDVDFTPYLSDKGRELTTKLRDASIADALGRYPGLTFAQLAKPEYRDPESIPVLVEVANQLIMGQDTPPSTPLFIGQGRRGEVEGTPGSKPGIGPGDAIAIAGDVRSLARSYCDQGVDVLYREYPLSHIGSVAVWTPQAIAWVNARFAGRAVPENCATIKPGNPIDPVPMP
jgi:hypothetical protein